MNREQAQARIGAVLELPRDGELQVVINGVNRLGTRFNDNAISQNALKQQQTLTLSARIGQKKSSLTINQLDDQDLIAGSIERLFETCRHLPDDDEVLPAPGEVIDAGEHAYSASADALEIGTVGDWVAAACRRGAEAGIDLAGLLSLAKSWTAYGDSSGGFAFERHHRVDYHVTASGSRGSGWAEHQGIDITADEVDAATRRAIEKCQAAQNPSVFEPRPCTVILEPQAVGDLMAMAFWYGFDQRARDEGRSAFSHYEQPLGRLSLFSEPANPAFPTPSFSNDGQRLEKSVWLDRGKPQQLITSRYWAKHSGLSPRPAPNNLILGGDGTEFDELIRSTDDGILVTRFWYIRATDPKSLGFTGMTRDGSFRIENGRITSPVVEMRWNESVLRLLDNVSDSGKPVATGEFLAMLMPALKVRDFHFSSLSE